MSWERLCFLELFIRIFFTVYFVDFEMQLRWWQLRFGGDDMSWCRKEIKNSVSWSDGIFTNLNLPSDKHCRKKDSAYFYLHLSCFTESFGRYALRLTYSCILNSMFSKKSFLTPHQDQNSQSPQQVLLQE